jgi:MFS family permease
VNGDGFRGMPLMTPEQYRASLNLGLGFKGVGIGIGSARKNMATATGRGVTMTDVPNTKAALGAAGVANPTQDATRPYILAWVMALLFYVLEYSTRSAPGVMIPQLEQAFGRSGAGVGSILGSYYYTYSITSLVAGTALDRYGAKFVVPTGACILGIGCLLFIFGNPESAYLARMLQGAGSAFAFTGAVYLASHGFSSTSLATAIGVTQSLGMLGGSAGQFVVGPIMQANTNWQTVWICIGIASLVVSLALILITPRPAPGDSVGAGESVLGPYRTVLSNPQSYLCGLVSGLLFAPTTIGAMTWGVAFFQTDRHFAYGDAVLAASMVPLGWAFGCPLMGWAADRIRLRKPVLIAGTVMMAVAVAQLTFLPDLSPASVTLFIFGVMSGVAMIPYTIIKEANPDKVKGSATGAINFIVFGVTALVGPIFASLFAKTLTIIDPVIHFRHASSFWLAAVILAGLLSLLLRETGLGRKRL